MDLVESAQSVALLVPVRRRYAPDDPFFYEGNVEAAQHCKWAYIAIDGDSEDNKDEDIHVGDEGANTLPIHCGISGCQQRFSSHAEFESHYQSNHRHCCATCTRVFPTSRLLEIHAIERHDLYFRAMAKRGDRLIFECLVDGCNERYVSDKARKRHLVRDHKYPRSFHFHRKPLIATAKSQRYRKPNKKAGGSISSSISTAAATVVQKAGGSTGMVEMNVDESAMPPQCAGGDGNFDMAPASGSMGGKRNGKENQSSEEKKLTLPRQRRKKKGRDPSCTKCFYFFKTDKGCVRGDRCPFLHTDGAAADAACMNDSFTRARRMSNDDDDDDGDDADGCMLDAKSYDLEVSHGGCGGSGSGRINSLQRDKEAQRQERDTAPDELADSLATGLQFKVPSNVSFGRRGHGRGFGRLARS